MQIDKTIIIQLGQIPWFENCGRDLPSELKHVQRELDEQQALILFASDGWADAKTEAQGDLTGYLSKHHYNLYGGYWNNLAKEASKLVEGTTQEQLYVALRRRGWNDEMIQPITIDLTRAVLEYSYRAKFRNVPAFFSTVLELYRVGHLPCGWSGRISQGPKGSFIAY